MTDEMTVQTKSSVTPMVVGGVLGAGAGAGATFIPKIKDYISESPKYKEFDDIVKETSNNDKFENDLIFFSSENEKNVYREKIYDIVNDKIDLFEKCINQIEVKQPFPYLDIRYNILGKLFKSYNIFPQIYPLSQNEESMLRYYVKDTFNNKSSIKH